MLTGRECAELVRAWLAAEDFAGMRMPPEGIEMILEGVHWLDSDEPFLTERDLYRQYVWRISWPVRMILIGRALERDRYR